MIRTYEWRILTQDGLLRMPPLQFNYDFQKNRFGFLDENMAMEHCRQVCRALGNDAPKRLVLVMLFVADD